MTGDVNKRGLDTPRLPLLTLIQKIGLLSACGAVIRLNSVGGCRACANPLQVRLCTALCAFMLVWIGNSVQTVGWRETYCTFSSFFQSQKILGYDQRNLSLEARVMNKEHLALVRTSQQGRTSPSPQTLVFQAWDFIRSYLWSHLILQINSEMQTFGQ